MFLEYYINIVQGILRKNPSALPYIPTRDKIAARDRRLNPPKLLITNRQDLTDFDPIPKELLNDDRKAKLAEIMDFIHQHRLFNKKRTVEYPPGLPHLWSFVNKAIKAHRQQSRVQLEQQKEFSD
ncbi:hypothetical protein RclHR1_20090002 [Rhizophagus clarus]|uniref:Uncharacterized protein n=1 Tax=Rhizophagus clarus TaxID=94130 RepID=A0A2Z6R660_9GLOM|nr:hypothetical protein RclHR1_20090002 [Rhizophagus clarus]GES86563.1 hypothetical protein RCL_jg18670.t1 [Rhizophagus clarus]